MMTEFSQESAKIRLPESLDLKAAATLRTELIELRGHDLELDGSDVQKIGGLCLQILMSAKRTWESDGLAFRIGERSAAFNDGLAVFGATSFLGDQAQG